MTALDLVGILDLKPALSRLPGKTVKKNLDTRAFGAGSLIRILAESSGPGITDALAFLDTEHDTDDAGDRLRSAIDRISGTLGFSWESGEDAAGQLASAATETLGDGDRSGVILAWTAAGDILVSPFGGGVAYQLWAPIPTRSPGRITEHRRPVAIAVRTGNPADVLVIGTCGLGDYVSGSEVRQALLAYDDIGDAAAWLLTVAGPRTEASVGLCIVPQIWKRGAPLPAPALKPRKPRMWKRVRIRPRPTFGKRRINVMVSIIMSVLAVMVLLSIAHAMLGGKVGHSVPRAGPPTTANPASTRVTAPMALLSRQTRGMDLTLSWGSVRGATGYVVRIQNKRFRASGPSMTLSGALRPGYEYSWQVRPIIEGHPGQTSASAAFLIRPVPVRSWRFHSLARAADRVRLVVQNPARAPVRVVMLPAGSKAHGIGLTIAPATTMRVVLLSPNRTALTLTATAPVLATREITRGSRTQVQFGYPTPHSH